MSPLIFTFYQGDYHYGVASLFNSAIRGGFPGRFCVFHNEASLPSWTSTLARTGENSFRADSCEIDFLRIDNERHFSFHKPFAALDLMRDYPDRDTFVYADPDILFLAPWGAFEDWFSQGLCYCLDSNFPYLTEHHPWRATWRRLLKEATGKDARPMATSPNGGFFSVTREEAGFLEDWVAITRAFEQGGGDSHRFYMDHRYRPIVSDQDLVGTTLMGWTGRESVYGPEGMGFTGHYFLMAHDVAKPKAWQRRFVREAIRGVKPSIPTSLYMQYCDGPIHAYSPSELETRRLGLKIAKMLTMVWRR